MKTRTKTETKMNELFPNWTLKFSDEITTEVFDEPTVYTPKFDERYSFPELEAVQLLTVIGKPQRNNIWISGPTGSGKTSLVRNLAAKLRVNYFEMNGHVHMTPANMFGRWTVRNGETHFQHGIMTKWLREGGWLLVNEYSTLDPDVVNSFKSVLEDPRYLCLTDNDDEIIHAHPDCRIIVADNTKGRGDDSGFFPNTHVHSMADMRRFHGHIVVDYILAEQETAMLKTQFPSIAPKAIEGFVKVANQTRKAYKEGSMQRVLSTAELINWAENYDLFATAHTSARISFLNSYEPEAATAVRNVIDAEFGNEDAETLVNEAAAARASDKTEV